MTFAELVAEVISITKRPDLSARIESNVRAATLKMHHSDFYYKDMHEIAVEFDSPAILQTFTPTEVAPLFRKAKYIRNWIGELDGSPGAFFTPIQIENSTDGYGYLKGDVFYMAGQGLQMRGKCAISRVLFGCYLHPQLTPVNQYNSWIAVEMPWAIIYEAARVLFKSIAFSEQANEYAQLVAEQVGELRLSYVDDVPVT
jgi:hypothetical protein